MTPEQWQRIEQLFHEAAELEPDKRAIFLREACGDEATLQKEVESLLAYSEKSARSLQAPVIGMIGDIIGDAPHQSIAGQTLDHYKILSPLAAGGMGEVYLAEDVRLNRKVAVKLLPASLVASAEQARRLQQEARAASALNHPNIVTIYELGQADSQPFIAMEFIEGYTLRQKIQSGSLKIREALDIAIQVASGLSAAHTAQPSSIIHRDIKPENIMVSRDGFVKILDFGIAKFREQQAVQAAAATDGALMSNTQASALWGTVSYMSPEQARGEKLDARTDIFSLGIVLFEMIAGRRPFAGETQAETLQAILNTEAQPLKAFRRDVSAGLQAILDKALKKKREERYQTAREMFDELREVSEQADTATDAKERANRMLRQYLSISAADKGVLIPITKLRFIRKYSDWRRNERGRELWQKSLRYGLMRLLALVVALLGMTAVAGTLLTKSETWEEAILKDGHTQAVRQAAFSPDGKLLISVSEDKRVIVWDFKRRMPIATFTDHTNWVQTVAFSPDGKWFATGGKDNSVIIWDAARLKKVTTLNDPKGWVINLAFSPDSKMLAIESCERPESQITLWAVGQWTKLHEFSAGNSEYGDLLFSPDGRLLFCSSQRIWDLFNGEEVTKRYNMGGWGGNWIALSPDGKQLASALGDDKVAFVDLQQRKILKSSPAHQDFGRAIAFSSDGKLIASGAEDVILWDATTHKLITHLVYTAIVWNVVFSPDGKYLISTHGDGAILLWSVEERKLIANLNYHSAPVRSVAFSPDGKTIASGSEDASIIIWDAEQRKKQEVVVPDNGRINSVVFSPDSKEVVSGGWSQMLHIWDVEQGQRRITAGSKGNINQIVAMSPNGRWAAGSHGVYDTQDGHIVFDFDNLPSRDIYGTAFSKNGRWLSFGSVEGYLYLLDTETWQLRDHIIQSDSPFISLSFSPDNKHIVTGDDKGIVQLWQIEPLKKVVTLGQHKGRIKSVAFSHDGKEVASAGDDNSIKLWSVRGGLIDSIGTHTAPVLSVAFSPDDKYLVSGEHDNSVRLYTRHQTYWGKRWD